MRIIAGEARGRRLLAPRGMDTRPTLDRIKESLFSILCARIPGAHVLDLFAGSGALGLEALSRGAAHAVFVDRARPAQEAVWANVSALRYDKSARLLRMDWRRALQTLCAEGARFDLVFLDPPYGLAESGEMLQALREGALLGAGALVVYEHARGAAHDFAGYAVWGARRYGDTEITFLKKAEDGGGDADSGISREL